ncbi:hypothetical protein ACFL54_05230 [Planctomycetota bacterium]
MELLLNFAKGPLFALCFTVMILGLLRIVILTIWGMKSALNNTLDKNVPYKNLFKETLTWIIPWQHISKTRPVFSALSFIFHIGLVIVPVFLLDHILLWRSGLGISWLALGKVIADVLTITTLTMAVILLGLRIFDRNSRFISGVMDYLLMIMIIVIFASGFFASRSFNPVPYKLTMLIHVLCGNAILFLIPFTKLAHCFLYPLMRFASNIAWRFPARAGEEINMALYGEENRKV